MIFNTVGSKQDPAILFFHAMGVTGSSSEPVARHLQNRRFCTMPPSFALGTQQVKPRSAASIVSV